MGSQLRVLGIDPGLQNMGWGVIELDGKRRVIVPVFELLVLESGDDSDGGPLS